MGLLRAVTASLFAVVILSSSARAEEPAAAPANPLDAIPDKAPFNVPYGTPITLKRAQAVADAALAEATKRGWPLNIAVVDSGGNLVTFLHMDNSQLGSIAVSQHKAHAAVLFRRPTKAFEDAIQKGNNYVMTLDGMIGSRGGIPLIEDGKIIGAVGCSGGTGSQDEVVCSVAAATIK